MTPAQKHDQCSDFCDVKTIHPEKIKKAKKRAIGGQDAERLADFFKVLSDPSRIQILSALVQEEMCVCDLAALLEKGQSAVSHQLRLLRTMNFVTNRREGTVVYYRLADKDIEQVLKIGLHHINE